MATVRTAALNDMYGPDTMRVTDEVKDNRSLKITGMLAGMALAVTGLLAFVSHDFYQYQDRYLDESSAPGVYYEGQNPTTPDQPSYGTPGPQGSDSNMVAPGTMGTDSATQDDSSAPVAAPTGEMEMPTQPIYPASPERSDESGAATPPSRIPGVDAPDDGTMRDAPNADQPRSTEPAPTDRMPPDGYAQ